mgnify:CR=1 FL=1
MAQQPVCKVCRQIRYFFLVAVPILVLIGTRTDVAVPAIPIEELFTWFIVIAFLLIVAFRVYKDYFSNNK